LTLDNQIFVANKGDILFLQDGALHGGIPENCIYECLVFDMKLLLRESNICAKLTQKIIQHEIVIRQPLPNNMISLQNIINNLFLAMTEKKTGYEFLTQGYLYQLLGFLLGEHLYEVNTNISQVSQQHVLIFKRVLSYIENTYTEHIALEDLSRIAGMNPKYFCRFFREMSYRTPIDYLNYYRVERACEQLSITKNVISSRSAP
jgi:YesN/AraC family two-component response regulator